MFLTQEINSENISELSGTKKSELSAMSPNFVLTTHDDAQDTVFCSWKPQNLGDMASLSITEIGSEI